MVLAGSAAANNVKIQRCYTPHLRTGLGTSDNSSKNIIMENVWGTDWGVFLMPQLNLTSRGLQSTPSLAAQTSVYGTHFTDHYTTAANPVSTISVPWTRITTAASITSNDHGLRVGDFINVTVSSVTAAIPLGQKTLTQIAATATPQSAFHVFNFACTNSGATNGTLTFVPLNGRVAVQMNEATTDTTSQVALLSGAAFTSAGGLYMPTINQRATFTAPANIRAHGRFPVAEAVMGGGGTGNITAFDIKYSFDSGITYKNLSYPRLVGGGANTSRLITMASTAGVSANDYVFGTNVAPNAQVVSAVNSTTLLLNMGNIGVVSGVLRFNQLPNETVYSPTTGFPLSIMMTTITANIAPAAIAPINSIYVYTHTLSSERAATYALDPVTVSVTVLDSSDSTPISGARVYLIADTGGPAVDGTVILNALTNLSGIATDTAYAYLGDQPVTGRVRRGTISPYYRTGILEGTITDAGYDSTIFLVADQ